MPSASLNNVWTNESDANGQILYINRLLAPLVVKYKAGFRRFSRHDAVTCTPRAFNRDYNVWAQLDVEQAAVFYKPAGSTDHEGDGITEASPG